jgi:hypothetical protein
VTNDFGRSILKVVQTDQNSGKPVRAKNVIVMFSDFSYGTTRIGEQSTKIRTTGTGSAVFFIDGAKTTGTWKRGDARNVTRFYGADGAEIKLNAGLTWISVAPSGTAVQ